MGQAYSTAAQFTRQREDCKVANDKKFPCTWALKALFLQIAVTVNMLLNDSDDYDLLKIKMRFIPHYRL